MSLTIIPQRRIGPFVAQATLQERHRDALRITRHPVEQGAAITDHSYKEPAEVVITAGWSNSDPANTGAGGFFGGITSILGTSGSEEYVSVLYQQLLELQESGIPFDVFTGKRDYVNMLIRELETETDDKTETTLVVRAFCEQVIIVQTQIVQIVPPEQQQQPQRTQSPVNAGPQQLRTLPPGVEPPT